jgi:hypothetical protein
LKVIDIANAQGNNVIINGMAIRRTAVAGSVPSSYELEVTFVKNPRAAAGNAISRDTVFRNYVVKKFPLRLDDCARTAAMNNNSVGPVAAPSTCANPVGPAYQFYSGGAANFKNYYSVQVCRDCSAAKTVITGCL